MGRARRRQRGRGRPPHLVRGERDDPGQDPYFIHHYRIDFDGSNLVQYTEADGNHAIHWSPDRRFYVDRYSRVDMPTVLELRRGSDRRLLAELEKGDMSEQLATGWRPPEVFVAKGRDGVTDIWGIIVRPTNFDPNRRYAVIENIYAGPHGSHVPKDWSPVSNMQSMAELGFIVVQIDGMGTSNRSKAFHDVAWQNLGDAGFPDRILWHRAVAEQYPWYDISRVGITGGSAGARTRRARCSSTGTSTRSPCRAPAATTTGWTRSGGTSTGWAGRSAPTTRRPRTW